MQINIFKVLRPVDLGDYAKEYQSQIIYVWVNPTRQFRMERDELDKAYATEAEKIRKRATDQAVADAFLKFLQEQYLPKVKAWFAGLFSQHADPATHLTQAELERIEAEDPALMEWLMNRAIKLIAEHRSAEKKG